MKHINSICFMCITFFLFSTPCFGTDSKLLLTIEENAWLDKNHTVHVRTGNAPPFMITKGEMRGIAIDYLTHIFKRNGISFTYISEDDVTWPQALNYIKQHKVVDMVPTAKITAERKKNMLFTDEYLFAPWVIFTRTDSEFLSSIDDLKGKTVSVEEGYVMQGRLQQDYPDINLKVASPNLKNYAQKPIRDLSTGLVDAYIGNLLMTTYIIQSSGFTNIKVAAPTPFDNHNQAMAIRNDWPELVSIINKTLAAMTPEEHTAIRNKWLTVRYEYGVSKIDILKWILAISFFSLTIFIIILLWNRKLKTEVTERKLAEEKERASKAYLYKIINNIGDPVFVKDGQLRFTLLNDAFCSTLGLPRGEIIGKTLSEDLPPDEMEHFAKIDRQVLTDGQENLCEELLTVKSGETLTIVTKKTRYVDENGDKFLIGVIRDITERKQAQEALRESTEKLHLIIDTSPVGICTVDPLGNFITTNLAYEQMLDYSKEELKGLSFFDVTHPDNRPKNKKLFHEMFSLETANFSMEKKYIRKDGTMIEVTVNATAVTDDEGKVRFGTAFVEDITERKQAEETTKKAHSLLKTAEKLAHIGSWEWDIQKDKFIMSDEWLQIHGVKNRNLTMTKLIPIAHPDDAKAIELNFKDALDGVRPYNITHRIIRQDNGEERVVYAKGAVSRDKEGKPCMVFGTAQDITDRKKAEEEKIQLESRLQQAQKMEAIGTLAGGIAHDFNNILAAIIGYTEMARDDSPSESSVAKDLGNVLEASARAVGLVRQILSFSRQDEAENVLLQPASLVSKAIAMLRPTLPTTIEITQDIDVKTGLIFGDPTQIHQILMNLCTNAFHAMEKTGGRLDISLKEIDLRDGDLSHESDVIAGTFIQLSVGDSGAGMTQEVKDKIFDPYFTTKGVGKGTGMGLSIVHGIVKAYGGFITLSSELGKGTTFNVFLPVANNEELPDKETIKQIPIGIEKILFIDDEDILADMGKTMLERLGYNVTVRKSSLEALETFQNQPDQFDVVITDQTMPGMTGIDLARRMLQIRPDIPIILCTGYSSTISEEKAKSFGIREFALKPVQKRNIAMLIRKVLDGNQA